MDICPEEFPYLDKKLNKCIKECDIQNFLSNNCVADNQNNESRENNLNKIKNVIGDHSIDNLLDDILKENGEDLTISEIGIQYQLSS